MCLCKQSAELFEGTTFTESQVQSAAFSRVVCQNEVVYTESCLCTLLENKTFLDYWFASVGISNLTLCTFIYLFFLYTHFNVCLFLCSPFVSKTSHRTCRAVNSSRNSRAHWSAKRTSSSPWTPHSVQETELDDGAYWLEAFYFEKKEN